MGIKSAQWQPEPEYPDAKDADSFQKGLVYQDFVCAELQKRHLIIQYLTSRKSQQRGESWQGWEVKLDERCIETGRLSIEVAEKSANDPARGWVPSGILKRDNTWLYLHGNYEVLFIFAKRFLLNYYWSRKPKVEESRGTIRKFYLPLDVARKHAARIIHFTQPSRA